MLVAGAVNMAMLLVAATNLQGMENTDSIEGAYAAVQGTLGPHRRAAVRDRPAGLRARVVVGRRVRRRHDHAGVAAPVYPLVMRRLVTLIPALVILAVGIDPSRALVLSQVVLSFGIPFALIPLVRLTANPGLMGADVNHRVTTALGWLVAGSH